MRQASPVSQDDLCRENVSPLTRDGTLNYPKTINYKLDTSVNSL